MTGLYIFGVVIVIGIGVFVYFKIKWSNEDRAEKRGHSDSLRNTKKGDIK
jgi:hypothetical protein